MYFKSKKLLFIFIFFCIGACVSEEFKDYYTPNVDLFIFRQNSSSQSVPVSQRGFDIEGVNNVVDYLYNFFSSADTSIHEFQEQNRMLFYGSKIRIFIVTPHRGVDTTYFGAYLLTESGEIRCNLEVSENASSISFADAGINRERAVIRSDNNSGKMLYQADLNIAGFGLRDLDLRKWRRLYLTNYDGTDMMGAEIPAARDNLRIFFSDRIYPCTDDENGGVGGIAILGNSENLKQNSRIFSVSAISSRYNVGRRTIKGRELMFGQGDTIKNLRTSISHEMGHIFGLQHSFHEKSCDVKPMNTTNRIMDYFSARRKSPRPSMFVPCEQKIYEELSHLFLDGEKKSYRLNSNGRPVKLNPRRQIINRPTMFSQNAVNRLSAKKKVSISTIYQGLSTINQLAVENRDLEIIDSTSYRVSSNENIQKETVSMDELSKLKYIP